MEFQIQKKVREASKYYNNENFGIARKFAKIVHDEFGNLVKAVVLFGGSTKKTTTHDIDIMIIVDDVSIVLTPEVVQTYRIIIEKAIVDISTKLHVTSLKFTSFWEYVRAGDPVAVNILRDGVAIFDSGFFDPLQMLLKQGRIRPTPESVWAYFVRAPASLHNSKWKVMQATLDLYWAVIDAAHAALMQMGEVPPSPEHVGEMIKEKMVKTGLVDKKYAHIANHFYELSKMILYKEITKISGEEYSKYYAEAEDFVDTMKKFIEEK